MVTPAPTDRQPGHGVGFDVERLRHALIAPGSPARQVDVVAETGSTNADLVARAAAGDDVDGALLVAEQQSAGRGRNGRSWTGVPGTQVMMSVGVNVDGIPNRAWGWIPLVTGLAVLDAVASTGVVAGLKWPNDVLARPPAQGKLAGILAEVASPAPIVVVGVGLNVTLQADELPDLGATSLAMLGGRPTDREELIVVLLQGLWRRVERLRNRSGVDAELLAEYITRCLTVGLHVRATLPGDRHVIGDARSVDDQGRLIVDTSDGVAVVSAGDIVHLRPVRRTDAG